MVRTLVACSLVMHLAAISLMGSIRLSHTLPPEKIIMIEMGRPPEPASSPERVQQPVIKIPVAISRPMPAASTPAQEAAPIKSATVAALPPKQAAPPENAAPQINQPPVSAQGTHASSQQTAPTEAPTKILQKRQIPVAAHPVTTVQGIKARDNYNSTIRAYIERNKEYPVMARRSRMEGKTVVRFILARNGTVKNTMLVSPCEHSLLNKAALAAVHAVRSFPPVPMEIPGEEIGFEVPIAFTLSGQ